MSAVASLTGVLLLAAIWLGPLPGLARLSFSAHMTMHMGVVAVAAPLIALALSRSTLWSPASAGLTGTRWIAAPIAASMIELVVVWAWHAPALHQAARHQPWALILEQGSFLLAGLLLWVTALGGGSGRERGYAGAGVVALLFTSMHMTLLGALFALSNRPLFQHTMAGESALSDQHLGGAIMLIVGGTSYLIGGLWLTLRLLLGVPRVLSGREPVERTSP
jgi:putative membrane protein